MCDIHFFNFRIFVFCLFLENLDLLVTILWQWTPQLLVCINDISCYKIWKYKIEPILVYFRLKTPPGPLRLFWRCWLILRVITPYGILHKNQDMTSSLLNSGGSNAPPWRPFLHIKAATKFLREIQLLFGSFKKYGNSVALLRQFMVLFCGPQIKV